MWDLILIPISLNFLFILYAAKGVINKFKMNTIPKFIIAILLKILRLNIYSRIKILINNNHKTDHT